MEGKERKSVLFYRSFYDSIRELPEANQLELYNAVFGYSFDFAEPDLTGLNKAIFSLIKPLLEANNTRYFNGSSGGRPKRKETESKPENNQTETELKPNQNKKETKPKGKEEEEEEDKGKKIKEEDKEEGFSFDSPSDFSFPEVSFDDGDTVDYAYYRNSWNSELPDHTGVSALTDKRRKSIKSRLPEFGKTKKEQQETFRVIIQKIKSSPFLSGDNDRQWKPSFDWVFKNEDNWRKIFEGKFDQKTNKPASANSNTVTLPDGRTITLGVGEYIHARGHRTLGQGSNVIPFDAPPRPGNQYYWDRVNGMWNFNSMM